MSDPIDREDALCVIMEMDPFWAEGMTRAIFEAIKALPSKRKKGTWIEAENEWGGLEIKCSECGAQVPRDEWGNAVQSDYCYRCGADMRGEEDGG